MKIEAGPDGVVARPPAPSLLSIRNLRVGFRQGRETAVAVDEVSFDIAKGESFALVGESGSGKSVTALSVLRLLPQNGRLLGGQVSLDGLDLLTQPEWAMGSIRGGRIGMIFQDPMTALNPVFTIGAQLREGLVLHHRGLRGPQLRSRALELLDQVGLPHPARQLEQYPHQLSGGMRQRAMIAMALAGEPDLLIADEPTTALDVSLQAQVLELLSRLRRETGMALWLITHDFGIVAEVADRVAVMRSGRLVETSGPEFFTGPYQAYSRELLAAMPRLDACLRRELAEPKAQQSNPPLLEVRDFRVWYPVRRGILQRTVDHVRAVDGVSLRLEAGETLALVGESGCGKTTLGKALLRLIPATAGEVLLEGRNILSQARKPGRTGLQIVFQDPYSSMNPRWVVSDILEEGLRIHWPAMSPAERRERVDALLMAVGLPIAARQRYPHEFSGGQRQRICIARALAVEPKVLVCDEPTSALDVSVQAQVLRLLRELQDRQGLSYLFITHDLAVVSELASRVAVMESGKVVEMGPVRQVLFAPASEHTRRLLASLPALHRTQGDRSSG